MSLLVMTHRSVVSYKFAELSALMPLALVLFSKVVSLIVSEITSLSVLVDPLISKKLVLSFERS